VRNGGTILLFVRQRRLAEWAALETGRSPLGGSNEMSLLHLEMVARGHIAGFGGVAKSLH